MHLFFLKEVFPQYSVALYAENDDERAEIKNQAFPEPIKI